MTSKSSVNFICPPIVETALSLQFSPAESLHVGHLGLLWGGSFKERYPVFSIGEEVPHQLEQFGIIPRAVIPRLEFMRGAPTPRFQISSNDQQYLLQIQKDRLILNWRKLTNLSGKHEYPRFDAISKRLHQEWGNLTNYIDQNSLGKAQINQVEFTYINHIDARLGKLSDIFNGVFNETHLPDNVSFESITHKLQHTIMYEGSKIGRLYTSIETAVRNSDNENIYVLSFIARVHPLSQLDDTLNLLRCTINEAFRNITTEAMHKLWKMT